MPDPGRDDVLGEVREPVVLAARPEVLPELRPALHARPLDRGLVEELAREPRLLLLCGRYEGVDERVREHLADLEVSIGDFVLSGGELPALLLIDAVARRLPGVLGGGAESLAEESFEDGLLEYPQYTRPAEFRGWEVPEVLRSGNHAEIARWRRRRRLLRTKARRPDLLEGAELSAEERAWLDPLDADSLDRMPDGPLK